MDKGLTLAIKAAGTRYRLAALIGVTPTAVLKWTQIPIKRVLDVERATGISREKLRPDFYRQKPTSRL